MGRRLVTPAEKATLQAAEDHEAAAIAEADAEHARAEAWESRALIDETEIGHLRALCGVLERTALPLLPPLDPDAQPVEVRPEPTYIYDSLDLPGRMAAIGEGP